jgi:heat shock protein HtpX
VERKAVGRDLGLTVRMLIVGTIFALMYVVLVVVTVLLVWAGRHDLRAWFVPIVPAVMIFGHYKSADRMVLRAAGARILQRSDAPDLHAMVERLSSLAQIQTPKVAIVRSDVPNAFATGRSPANTVVAVTTGLLERLQPDEVESVVAHELAHIANRDALVITLASFFQMVGALFSRRRFGTRDFAEEVKLNDFRDRVAFAIIKPFALLFYAFTTVLTLAMSRYREYAADRGSALLTGRPEQLMSGLQKISGDIALIPDRDLRGMSGLNAFFIIPTSVKRRRLEFLLDHPPLEKRLRELTDLAREMGRPVR